MSPSAPYPQPDHAAIVIQELLEWLPKHYINGINGPSATPNYPFMSLPDLQIYLKTENRTTKLLRALSVEGVHQGRIQHLEKYYIRVFIILILIGKGRYIEHFVQHANLRDPHLPFLEKPRHFPVDPTDPPFSDSFFESFFEKQFSFCPHLFGYNENSLKLEDRCVLPIVSKEVLGHGGSAAIYKIKLHPHYDELSPVGEASQTYSGRPANTYVLKTYNTKDADIYYANEVDAFMKLSTKNAVDENLIKLMGSYKQGDTYNILLEYADRGTLEDFFQNTTPPSLGHDIIVFWSRLFNVIKALQRIHVTERPDGFCDPDILIGWHQDVKPKNILSLSGNSNNPYDVEFKLGDLGLSHFKRTQKLDRKIVDGDVGGTKDYGAPECHRSDEFLEQIKLDVKPSIDIWSFGCVCSEAAVWVVLGMPGLVEYRHRRQQEICEKGTSQDGSCFHDGERVLTTVEDMHERLLMQGEIRPGDYVTRFVLNQMVTTMLDEDPDQRLDPIILWKRAKKILDEAAKKLEKSNQHTNPESDPVGSKKQYYGPIMPTTPPHTPYRPPQAPHGNSSHPHGPPPHRSPYSPSYGTPGRPPPPEQRLGRPGTWHGRNFNPDMAPSSLHGSPSPPVANHRPLGAKPPVDTSSNFQERPELYSTTSDPSNGLRNDHRSFRDCPQPENNIDASFSNFPQSNSMPSQDHRIVIEPPTPTTTKAKIPYLSLESARQTRLDRGALLPEHQNLLNDLQNRDHVFLIDDSLSMRQYWGEVVSLFSVLAYILKKLDDDGLEMYFTVSTDKRTFKDTRRAVSHLEKMTQSTYSNIDARLQQILGKYQVYLGQQRERRGFFRSRANAKPLSLYVFTDAAWQGCDAIAPIEAMIEKQRQLGFPKDQVSIQFVRFGNDASGIERLEYLDSGLRKKHTKKWDIVDTEPFQGGNLLKMLLGATFDWFDDDG